MTVKDYATVCDPTRWIVIFFLNDVEQHYYAGTGEQLKRDIQSDKSLGSFKVGFISKGDSINNPAYLNSPAKSEVLFIS